MRRVDSELQSIIREMEPELNPGVYVYSVAPAGAELGGIDAVALIREREGWTVAGTHHDQSSLRSSSPSRRWHCCARCSAADDR